MEKIMERKMVRQLADVKLWLLRTIKNSGSFVLDLFFPIECLGCRKEGEWVCADCSRTILLNIKEECPYCHNFSQNGQTCFRCRKKERYLDGLVAGSSYGIPLVRRIITYLKYRYIQDLAQTVARMMLQGLYFHGMFLEEEWVLVPVPLHARRLRERGFNQADLFCRYLETATGFCHQAILSRVRFTPPQAALSREDRLINLKNVFVYQGGREIKNKKILLVDDVLTTGTTLNECARVLKQAGAKEIWGLVGARG